MNDDIIVKDSNGTILSNGDSVTLIKDLKVKGPSVTLKRGQRMLSQRLASFQQASAFLGRRQRPAKASLQQSKWLSGFVKNSSMCRPAACIAMPIR